MAEPTRAIGHETNRAADEDQDELVACLTIGFSDQLSTIMASEDRLGRVIRLLRDELEAGGQRAVRAAKGIGHGFDWAAETRRELPEELRSIGQELLRYLVETTDHAFFRAGVGVMGRMAKRMPAEVAMCLIAVANDASKPARNRVGALDALGRSAELLAAALPGIARLVQDSNDLVNQKALHFLDVADKVGQAANEWFGETDDLDDEPKAEQNALLELDIFMRWGVEVWTIMSAGTGIRELRKALGELDPDLRAAAIPVREKRKERFRALRERKTSVPDPLASGNIFRKDGVEWQIRYDGGKFFPLKDRVGLFYIAYLIEQGVKPLQAEDLWDAHPKHRSDRSHRTVTGAAQAARVPADESDSGGSDRGNLVIDRETAQEIYVRLAEIRDELERAKEDGDAGAEMALKEEQGKLLDQVRAAMTPGGDLRVFDKAHKKRHNAVRKAIMEAIEAIRISDARLGLHLKQSIPLDRPFFQYEPANPIPWSL